MNKEKLGEKIGHELNLLFQKGQYLTTKGWKNNEQLGQIVLDIIEELSNDTNKTENT